MALRPTLCELEQAIHVCTSSASHGEIQTWQAMTWLWNQLSWSARFMTHFGASGFAWWKQRYIFPILCQESIPYLEKFLDGDWTYVEEESLRHVFHFWAPYSAKNPGLFPQRISKFLSGPCPSFHTERDACQSRVAGGGEGASYSWLADETFATYRSRMNALVRRIPRRRTADVKRVCPADKQQAGDQNTEAMKEKAKKCIEAITSVRDQVEELSAMMDRDVAKAFPLRKEGEQMVADLQQCREEAFSLLFSVDALLMQFSEEISACLPEQEGRTLIHDAEQSLTNLQKQLMMLRSRRDPVCSMIEEHRAAIGTHLQALSRLLDRVPILESAHPFRLHQTRIIRLARDKLKGFRGAISKGPGPEETLRQLECEIERAAELAKDFYDEGRDIVTSQERLHELERRIQKQLSAERHVVRITELRDLLSEVQNLRESLGVASDRKRRVDLIDQHIRELELQAT